uniref:Uncharacterized protein n=1 Tax=Fagus sylvatica TaxID=28930 RepID=A0A2N9EQB9_FAGSY
MTSAVSRPSRYHDFRGSRSLTLGITASPSHYLHGTLLVWAVGYGCDYFPTLS